MSTEDRAIVLEQLTYYRARAAEYDEWFLRRGRYDRGDEHRRLWFDEVAAVEAALIDAHPAGDILELACGTGLWTRHLEPKAASLLAVDASPEVIALNRARLRSSRVEYVQADLFRWVPTARYDFVFFGFWLSHVPPEQFEPFWNLVKTALRPKGTVFFVDSRATPESTAPDQTIEMSGVVERRLNDGRTFRIVKIFYEPSTLIRRLGSLGLTGEVKATANFFIYGRLNLG